MSWGIKGPTIQLLFERTFVSAVVSSIFVPQFKSSQFTFSSLGNQNYLEHEWVSVCVDCAARLLSGSVYNPSFNPRQVGSHNPVTVSAEVAKEKGQVGNVSLREIHIIYVIICMCVFLKYTIAEWLKSPQTGLLFYSPVLYMLSLLALWCAIYSSMSNNKVHFICSLRWMDGTTLGFQKWEENEPNTDYIGASCVVMTSYMGEWCENVHAVTAVKMNQSTASDCVHVSWLHRLVDTAQLWRRAKIYL